MTANNEMVCFNRSRRSRAWRTAQGRFLHTDASTAKSLWMSMNWAWICSRSRRKLYGPSGIGALYIRPGVQAIDPVLHGGGHERGLRPGTLNVPAIVGFGAAARSALRKWTRKPLDSPRYATSCSGLLMAIPDLCVNGSMAARLPQNLNISVPGVDPEMLGPVLDDLAVSTGPRARPVTMRPLTSSPPWDSLESSPGVDSLWAGPMDDRRGDRVCHGTRHSRGARAATIGAQFSRS